MTLKSIVFYHVNLSGDHSKFVGTSFEFRRFRPESRIRIEVWHKRTFVRSYSTQQQILSEVFSVAQEFMNQFNRVSKVCLDWSSIVISPVPLEREQDGRMVFMAHRFVS